MPHMNLQNGYDVEDLTVGMTGEIAKTITDADVPDGIR